MFCLVAAPLAFTLFYLLSSRFRTAAPVLLFAVTMAVVSQSVCSSAIYLSKHRHWRVEIILVTITPSGNE